MKRVTGSGIVGGRRRLEDTALRRYRLLLVIPILLRAAQEDRFLRDQLEGYAAYAQKVRYRIFPGVW